MEISYESEVEKKCHPVLVKKVYKHSGSYLCHWHDYFEFIYVESGGLKLIMEDSIYDIAEGDFAVIYPGTFHDTVSPVCIENSSVLIVVQFYLSYLNINPEHMEYSNITQQPQETLSRNYLICGNNENTEKIQSIIRILFEEYTSQNTGFEYMIKGYIYQLLGYIERIGINHLEIGEKSTRNFDIRKVIEYIEEHCGRKISLTEAAGHSGYSTSYFSREFKKRAGISFKKYVDFIKIRKARNRILSGKFSVTEVASSFGYDDVQNFCRTYKRITGHTASEDKKR